MEDKKFVITKENSEEYVTKIGNWIKENIKNANANGVVLGMSGGVDCSTVAALCSKNNINVHLILMPYGDSMEKTKNFQDAMKLVDRFSLTYDIFDIKPTVDSLEIKDTDNKNEMNLNLAKANLRPRVRMTYLYEFAQINNLLVIGTGNLSERTVRIFYKMGRWSM